MTSLLKYTNVLNKKYSSAIGNTITIRRCYATIYRVNIRLSNQHHNHNHSHSHNNDSIRSINRNSNTNIIIKRSLMTETIPSVFNAIQISLHALQSTGFPWWATFALSTIIVRSSMFPLVRSQLLYTKKITNAMPEISFLYQLLNKRLQGISIHQTEERLKIINVFIKGTYYYYYLLLLLLSLLLLLLLGVTASLKLHDFSILRMLSYPAANISIFLTFIISIREMIKNDVDLKYGFQDGGLLWFADLTMKDGTFILPFLAITLSYTALDIAFSNGKGNFFIYTKDFCQCITLLSIPLVIQLPSGIFFYWIPSSIFAITQSLLLRNDKFQKIMNIPTVSKPKHLDTTKNDTTNKDD